jgi:hypothetical protein
VVAAAVAAVALSCRPEPGVGTLTYSRSGRQHALDLATCRDRIVRPGGGNPRHLTSPDGRFEASLGLDGLRPRRPLARGAVAADERGLQLLRDEMGALARRTERLAAAAHVPASALHRRVAAFLTGRRLDLRRPIAAGTGSLFTLQGERLSGPLLRIGYSLGYYGHRCWWLSC